jgi:hypothetical protein
MLYFSVIILMPSPTRGEGAQRRCRDIEPSIQMDQAPVQTPDSIFKQPTKIPVGRPSFRDGALAPDLRCAIAHRGISRFRVRCFASPRNDGLRLRIPAAGFARVVHEAFALRKQRAWGMPGVDAPAASCVMKTNTRVSHHRSTGLPGIPARNGFTAYFALSPATRLYCHRRLRIMVLSKARLGGLASAKLDASIGASEPHDFTVRFSAVRLRACDRSRI